MTGTYSNGTKKTVRDIGRRLTGTTGSQRETFLLTQRLSFTVQGDNAGIILCGENEMKRYLGN